MKLKTVTVGDKTYAEILDGKPVYVEDDGKETAFDAAASRGTITRLNGEAQGHREQADKAKGALKAFEGITDPAAAIKALETLANIDAKKLIDAGQVDVIKAGVAKAYEDKIANMTKTHGEQVATLTGERDGVTKSYHSEKLAAAFAGSKFVKEKTILPAEVAQSHFGTAFKVEDGQIVAYDGSTKIFSRGNPANPASFDEALEVLVDKSPTKEYIMKAKGGGAGGGPGNGHTGGGKVLSRSAYDALSLQEQGAKMTEGYTVTD